MSVSTDYTPDDPSGRTNESDLSLTPISSRSIRVPTNSSDEIQPATEFYERSKSLARMDYYNSSSSTGGGTSDATAPRPNPYSSSSGTGGKMSSQSLLYSSGSGDDMNISNSTSRSVSMSEHTDATYLREQGLLTTYTTSLKDADGPAKRSESIVSPIHRKMQQELDPMQPRNQFATPIDPDGETSENYSLHGESLQPTVDDDFRDTVASSSAMSQDSFREDFWAETRASNVNKSGDPEGYLGTPPPSEDAQEDDSITSKPRNSSFPSFGLLTILLVAIILGIGAIAGGTTWYFVGNKTLDPIPPPNSSPVPTMPLPPSQSPPGIEGPSDTTLLKIFQSVLGEEVLDATTAAGMAADWMLYQDPSRHDPNRLVRSENAWLQRYLLVYFYYATTDNQSSRWLSCNPPISDEMEPIRKGQESIDDQLKGSACEFMYPTELPNGRVIYDLVPSHRWLSAADECQWGGVACGTTVTDEIGSDLLGEGEETISQARLAVTSIVLADQNLTGNLVNELTELPELQVLDLSHNGLGGFLTDNFRSLQTLRLQYNKLIGYIPGNFFDAESKMQEFNVGSNGLLGPIPQYVGLASQMRDLYLFDNYLTGTIPALGNMPLVNFQGQGNEFTGILPFDYGYGGKWPDTLRSWWAFDNALSGSLGENLGFLTSLEDLRLEGNKLTGSVPDSIGELQRLFRLELSDNDLTGTIPTEVGRLPVLRDVRVEFNSITGTIPSSLCFLESMELLVADCLAGVPTPTTGITWSRTTADAAVQCYCCTSCCNDASQQCKDYGL